MKSSLTVSFCSKKGPDPKVICEHGDHRTGVGICVFRAMFLDLPPLLLSRRRLFRFFFFFLSQPHEILTPQGYCIAIYGICYVSCTKWPSFLLSPRINACSFGDDMAPTENVCLKGCILYSPNYVSPLDGSWWLRASLVAQMVKNPPAIWETQVQSLGWQDPLEKGMATHSSILAWKIPWTEEPGGLQSMGWQRVRHEWVTNTFIEGSSSQVGQVLDSTGEMPSLLDSTAFLRGWPLFLLPKVKSPPTHLPPFLHISFFSGFR